MKHRKLTTREEDVIVGKGTEPPFSGKYEKHFEGGIYACRRCGAPLYKSESKFDSHCGWPSFDDELPGAVKRLPDPDGARTEIQCASCGAHLGHLFKGEHLTQKNTRHCVNSVSLEFIPREKVRSETIVLGGGCFWCTEAAFSIVPGVISVAPGYAGGNGDNPTYNQVCSGLTGHAEVVRVEYLPATVPLEKLLDIFFTIHDPTQVNRQGNDRGSQYRSIILFTSGKQEKAVRKYMGAMAQGYGKPVTTEVKKLRKFYPAEESHREYYKKNPNQPYCLLGISPKIRKVRKMLPE